MSDLLRQLPAVIGVLIGALATVVATRTADRARWRRDERVRWDERRLSTYVDFIDALGGMTQVAMAMAGGRGLFFHTNPVDLADGSRLMDDAQRKWRP